MSLTLDNELDLLFPAHLIPADVKSKLPSDLHIRPLASTDYHRGHLSVLSVLTDAPDPGLHAYTAQFNRLRASSSGFRSTYTLVILNRESDKVVAVGTVFIEAKFTRNLGLVGHIEDIAVDKSQQGKKLGLRVIEALTGISENAGCYKTILNCSEANVAFYDKCGYSRKGAEMAKYTPERSHSPRL